MKFIAALGSTLAFAACAEPVEHRQAAAPSQDILRRKPVRSPYIAYSRPRVVHFSYPKPGEYRTYGVVEAPSPIAAAPEAAAPSNAVAPPGAQRRVINQITNEPVR